MGSTMCSCRFDPPSMKPYKPTSKMPPKLAPVSPAASGLREVSSAVGPHIRSPPPAPLRVAAVPRRHAHASPHRVPRVSRLESTHDVTPMMESLTSSGSELSSVRHTVGGTPHNIRVVLAK